MRKDVQHFTMEPELLKRYKTRDFILRAGCNNFSEVIRQGLRLVEKESILRESHARGESE